MTNCRSLCQYDKLTRDKLSQPLEAWSLELEAFRLDQYQWIPLIMRGQYSGFTHIRSSLLIPDPVCVLPYLSTHWIRDQSQVTKDDLSNSLES